MPSATIDALVATLGLEPWIWMCLLPELLRRGEPSTSARQPRVRTRVGRPVLEGVGGYRGILSQCPEGMWVSRRASFRKSLEGIGVYT